MNSAAATGRRKALLARRWTISVAQSCSLRVEVGRQVKTARRLSVSEMPVTFCGPAIARSFRCGIVVMP